MARNMVVKKGKRNNANARQITTEFTNILQNCSTQLCSGYWREVQENRDKIAGNLLVSGSRFDFEVVAHYSPTN